MTIGGLAWFLFLTIPWVAGWFLFGLIYLAWLLGDIDG
jgi:hypothetical protein